MSVTINGTTGITTPSLDNDGGTIDGTTIGGTTAAAGSFTTVSASGLFTANSTGALTQGVAGILINGYSGDNNWAGGINFKSYNGTTVYNGISNSTNGMVFATGSSSTIAERLRITAGGLVGIGTTSPSYQLQLGTDSAGKPSSSTWTVVSDERIKTDIIPADLDRCYEIVKTVPLKRYSYADGVYTDEQIQDKQVIGWIAQDVQQVFAKAVSVKPFTKYPDDETRKEVIEDCLDLNGSQMYAAMYGAVQKLMQKVEALETEVLLLKGAM